MRADLAASRADAPIRVVFMGTPAFAVPTLELLIAHHDVVAVFTQPDRPAGRGRRPKPSPVKDVAAANGIPVHQPRSLRKDEAAVELLERIDADGLVVAAYGLLLPRRALDAARSGALNVHASLLPRWRGAAPVHHAILAGDPVTGVTIMRMDEGLDTGPIVAQAAVGIRPDETTGTLTARLADLGADLLADALPRWVRDEIATRPQDGSLATHAPRIAAAEGRLDWSVAADVLARRVRAMNPWPGAFTALGDDRLKVHAATVLPDASDSSQGAPGTVVAADDMPAVVTAGGLLRLDTVQPAGKRAMSGADFLRGRREVIGAVLADARAV